MTVDFFKWHHLVVDLRHIQHSVHHFCLGRVLRSAVRWQGWIHWSCKLLLCLHLLDWMLLHWAWGCQPCLVSHPLVKLFSESVRWQQSVLYCGDLCCLGLCRSVLSAFTSRTFQILFQKEWTNLTFSLLIIIFNSGPLLILMQSTNLMLLLSSSSLSLKSV